MVWVWAGDVAQLDEHWIWCTASAGLYLWCGKGFFSQSLLSVKTPYAKMKN